MDLFYNPTPLLRAVFTVNTDFAQTEVDQRQTNLTRFSLFFPERRDFFLDGSTFFDFGSGGGNTGGNNNNNNEPLVTPFFSRRIGLSAQATPQQINFGTKLTGQMGAQDVGVLHVRTGDDADAAMIGEDFTVGRVKRRLFQQSYIGGIYTRRDAPAMASMPATPSASTCGWRRRASSARRTCRPPGGRSTPRVQASRAATMPSGSLSTTPMTCGPGASACARCKRPSIRRSAS